jgi:hypothetical protein
VALGHRSRWWPLPARPNSPAQGGAVLPCMKHNGEGLSGGGRRWKHMCSSDSVELDFGGVGSSFQRSTGRHASKLRQETTRRARAKT